MKEPVIEVNIARLRLLRIASGLTQVELAEQSGISVDTLVRWENGRVGTPHPAGLKRIAERLGVDTLDLLRDVA